MRTDARVIAWWSGYCSDCADGSEMFEDEDEADAWVSQHNRDNHSGGETE